MANTYLTRTASGTDGSNSQRKNTVSMWLKRTSLSDACFIEGQGNNANATQAYFDSNANLTINHVSGDSSLNFQIVTNRKFRDTSAWYHIVITIDTSLGTAADRVKIYVNGVRETSFASASYPGQNATTQLLARLNLNIIGRRQSGGTGLYFDGSMSHIHVTDGTAYDASYFGETDATTGEWKIKTSPSVTYGTNGFFILKDGNSVTDQSGNSNNFTVGGGTLTKTEDCPSNVFATFNPLASWRGQNNTPQAVLANGNLKTGIGTSEMTLLTSTIGVKSGKYYWEAKSDGVSKMFFGVVNSRALGETNAPHDSSSYSGIHYYEGTTDFRYYSGATSSTGAVSISSGDILGFAMDCDNSVLWIHKNGVYMNSGVPTSGDTGTGGINRLFNYAGNLFYDGGVKTEMFASAYVSSTSGSGTASFNFGNGYFGTTAVSSAGTNASGNGIFEFDVPTGYTALSTKGLNL